MVENEASQAAMCERWIECAKNAACNGEEWSHREGTDPPYSTRKAKKVLLR